MFGDCANWGINFPSRLQVKHGVKLTTHFLDYDHALNIGGNTASNRYVVTMGWDLHSQVGLQEVV